MKKRMKVFYALFLIAALTGCYAKPEGGEKPSAPAEAPKTPPVAETPAPPSGAPASPAPATPPPAEPGK